MTNKETLVGKLTNIADGFRSSRSLTETLSLDEMATLAAVPIGSADNKLAQLANGTITEVTAEDFGGAIEIRELMFAYCGNLISVELSDSIRTADSGAFRDCSNLETVTGGANLTKTGRLMFYQCKKLRTIPLGNKITEIGYSCFQNCESLENVTLPDTLLTIDYSGFNGCKTFTNITIPNSTIAIREWVFDNCDNLTNMTIGTGIQSIGNSALKIGAATNKATITFLGTTPPTITTNTFNATYLNKIIVPAGSGDAYKTATNWANFADYIEEATE